MTKKEDATVIKLVRVNLNGWIMDLNEREIKKPKKTTTKKYKKNPKIKTTTQQNFQIKEKEKQ